MNPQNPKVKDGERRQLTSGATIYHQSTLSGPSSTPHETNPQNPQLTYEINHVLCLACAAALSALLCSTEQKRWQHMRNPKVLRPEVR